MPDVEPVVGGHDADDVEAGVEVEVVLTDVCVGGAYKVAYLAFVDGFFGSDDGVLPACFYFDDDEHVAVLGDDVDFFVPGTPVGVQDEVAFGFEIVACDDFGFFAEVVVLCHDRGVIYGCVRYAWCRVSGR